VFFFSVQADPDIRIQMFKLRMTWKDVFPPIRLHELDLRCNELDKHWNMPKSAPVSQNAASIHVNPKFLGKVS